ncbi:ribbon-helix-helix protein, CopG family [Rhizobium sp. FY34]|uniref:CopG family ribbon-helix-helix protein n=1 Tax=Rhizobium sp. FY34 TaxID=2562309 RepID=UPI0010C1088E|nr:ribbon-helix-helix protein, CopG family [Rhizobium sp. FY34]
MADASDRRALSDPITLRIPQDILAEVEQIAKATERSRSWVIVRALKYYLMAEGNDILQILKGEEQVRNGEFVEAEDLFADLLGDARPDAA